MSTTLADAPDRLPTERRIDGAATASPPDRRPPEHARRSRRALLPWAGASRPSTMIEEHRFVARLVDLAEEEASDAFDPNVVTWSRRDVTAVVTALRGGIEADELLRQAPGLRPERLVAAHRAVEARRRVAERAWAAIVADPTPGHLAAHGDAVAMLLPVVVARLEDQARHGESHLVAAVDAASTRIERLREMTRAVEDWLAGPASGAAPGIAELLDDLDGPGLWGHDHFLAPRVGALVPSRLAALLGERPAGRR